MGQTESYPMAAQAASSRVGGTSAAPPPAANDLVFANEWLALNALHPTKKDMETTPTIPLDDMKKVNAAFELFTTRVALNGKDSIKWEAATPDVKRQASNLSRGWAQYLARRIIAKAVNSKGAVEAQQELMKTAARRNNALNRELKLAVGLPDKSKKSKNTTFQSLLGRLLKQKGVDYLAPLNEGTASTFFETVLMKQVQDDLRLSGAAAPAPAPAPAPAAVKDAEEDEGGDEGDADAEAEEALANQQPAPNLGRRNTVNANDALTIAAVTAAAKKKAEDDAAALKLSQDQVQVKAAEQDAKRKADEAAEAKRLEKEAADRKRAQDEEAARTRKAADDAAAAATAAEQRAKLARIQEEKDLNVRLSALNKELESLNARNAALEREKRQALEKAKNQQDALKADQARFEAELEAFSKKNEAETAALQRALAERNAEFKAKIQEASGYQGELERVRAQLTTGKQEAAQLASELKASKDRETSLGREVAQYAEAIKKNASPADLQLIASKSTQLATEQQQRKQLEEEVKKLNAYLVDQNTKLAQVNAKLDAAASAAQTCQGELQELQKQARAIPGAGEAATLRAQLNALQEDLATCRARAPGATVVSASSSVSNYVKPPPKPRARKPRRFNKVNPADPLSDDECNVANVVYKSSKTEGKYYQEVKSGRSGKVYNVPCVPPPGATIKPSKTVVDKVKEVMELGFTGVDETSKIELLRALVTEQKKALWKLIKAKYGNEMALRDIQRLPIRELRRLLGDEEVRAAAIQVHRRLMAQAVASTPS